MASAPAAFAAPLTTRPLPYGLLSVADVVTDASGHWQNGVEVDGDPCLVTQFTESQCDASAEKEVVNAYTSYAGDPFTVYLLNSCKTVGRVGDAEERTIRAFERSETAGVESGVMEKILSPNAVIVAPGPFAPGAAVGLLEGWAAKYYGALPMLHMARSVVSAIAEAAMLQRGPAGLESFLGTPIAAGGGYEDNVGPAGSGPTPDGTAWIYISGALRLTRGNINAIPMVIDTATNDFYVLAERTYVGVVDCLVAAVQVQLPCCQDCG